MGRAAPAAALSTALLEMGPRLVEFLIESTGDGVFEWDLVTDQIRYSLRWKMLLGYEDREIADVPASWRQLSHPDDLPAVDEALRDHLENVWPFAHSWRMRHHNGEWRWILCRAMSERDEHGAPARLFAVFTDIHDQVTAEERQKALANAIPDLMLRMGDDGRVLDLKRAALPSGRLVPPTVGEKLASGSDEPASWTHQAVAAVREAIASGRIAERECVTGQGRLFLELRVVRSGEREAVCIVRDITARREAEQAQRALQAELDRLHEAERQRLADELDVARHIQTAILPAFRPIPGLDVSCHMWPATEVGGDYFDVLPCADGAWLAIGDVSGHGVNAGMIMLMVQSAIASVVNHDPRAAPSTVLRSVNRVLFDTVRNRMHAGDFVTCTLLRYWNDGRIVFAGAHEDMIVVPEGSAAPVFVPTPGNWLGVSDDGDDELVDSEYRLHPGDVLMLYTDGATEARRPDGVQFGADRLAAAAAEARHRPVDDLRAHVKAAIDAWTPTQDDDISLVLARQRR